MDIITSLTVLIALTIGLTEVIKKALGLNKRFLPLTALVIGFSLNLIGSITEITSLTILTGIVVGLSASGLFDNLKYPLQGLRE